MALGLAWVALAAGCGGGGDADRRAADTSQLARAERSLQSELEAAVEHLGVPARDGQARGADALRRPRRRPTSRAATGCGWR